MLDPNPSFKTLRQKILDKFNEKTLTVKYKDEEGDFVLLCDQEDLDLAISIFGQQLELWCFDS